MRDYPDDRGFFRVVTFDCFDLINGFEHKWQ